MMLRFLYIMNIDAYPPLIIELHDFTPRFYDENMRVLDELDKIGKSSKRVIHVVPNWGGDNNILHHQRFLDMLNALQDNGDEIILHGNTHRRSSRKYPSLYKKILGEYRYRGDAELLTADYAEALLSIRTGKKILHDAGIYSQGYVPPTWHLSEQSQQAVIDEGFKYIGLRHSLRMINIPRNINSPAGMNKTEDIKTVCLEVTANPRMADYIFRAYNSWIISRLKNDVPLRFPLHPHDLAVESTFKYALNILNELSQALPIRTFGGISSSQYRANSKGDALALEKIISGAS
jgi:predicted deacetylase